MLSKCISKVFLLVMACCLTACGEDEMVYDEWNSTFIYLKQPVPGENVLSYTVLHSPKGINGNISVPITISSSKIINSDISVNLKTDITGDFSAGLLDFKLQHPIVISQGQTVVFDTLYINLSEWENAPDMAEDYRIDVSIASLSPQINGVSISTHQNSIGINLSKSMKSNVITNKKPTGAVFENRSFWDVSAAMSEGGDWKSVGGDITDDSGMTSLFGKGQYLGVQIDLKEEKKITGLQTNTWYKFRHEQCIIETSNDGVSWTRQCDKVSIEKAENQYVSFITPVNARYIRWHMYASKSTVIDEIYVFGE